jgi:type IV fimbrial biogenesis protein FimT
MMRQAKTSSGFTLIELLVTLMVASILFSMAVPAFRTLMQNDRQWTQDTNLVVSLNAARSEAIKQDIPGGITVCASTDGQNCSGDPTTWPQGWIVTTAAAGGTVAQSTPALASGTTLTEANALARLTFYSNGTVNTAAAFTMCDSRGAASARYTQVSSAGRVISSVGKKPDGTALACP